MAGIELTGSALTALFVALVYTLIKVVEYFIGKKKAAAEKPDALSEEEHEILDDVAEKVDEMHKLHMVYDQNHLPLWYVPRELITLAQETDRGVKMLEGCVEEMKSSQMAYMEKITELITSQTLLAQRIGDLIAKMDRNIS